MNVIDAIGSVTRKLSRGSARFRISKSADVELNELARLADVPAEAQEELFMRKLDQCCVAFDFNDPQASLQGKETKTAIFKELIDFVRSDRPALSEKVYPEIVRMFSQNVIRVLPPSDYEDVDSENDDEPWDATWPHVSLAYDFFLAFIDSDNFAPGTAKKYIDRKFVVKLLELLDSEDVMERASLKTIVHRLYSKMLGLRAFLRKQIGYIFLRFAYETEKFNGMNELLEVLGSIINGFAQPLKEEHKRFLLKVLMPLHKTSSFADLHLSLTYCVTQFIVKDPSLTEPVVKSLLRMWPKTCSLKEVLFVSKVEEILKNIGSEEDFAAIAVPVCRQLAKCCSSLHFQVADKALSLQKSDEIWALLTDQIEVVMPILYPALLAAKNHWSQNIVASQAASFSLALEEYYAAYCEHKGSLENSKTGNSPGGKKYLENNNCVVTSF
ncbi:serine threonine-protein phosphatase 2A 56 kDa regulatory subunit [Nesidiocoris tenuis]|uniref:Serine threonine-protein phosphatase 2A 56 kDa regulatory subunit n=1 Tax=Nesidiocoris tenuis TaxID=355587 RepID=A0ABN7BBL7_9HEMI|nr:serine threonine-protein phosphatase 2A 56 kDa regulatory subunit [Nesidiocoris tenuis]